MANRFKCGDCDYYSNGKCHKNPPRLYIHDGKIDQALPSVDPKDIACKSFYRDTPINVEPVQELPFPRCSILGLLLNPRTK